MLQVYFLLIIMGLFGSVGYGAYWYYNDTQARITQLRENNTKLELANEQNQETIENMQEQAEQNAARMQTLQADLQKAEKYGDELRSTLQKHNLTQLALRKPGLIQNRINSASDKILDDITADTTPVSNDTPD